MNVLRNFVTWNLLNLVCCQIAIGDDSPHVQLRGSLQNSRAVFTAEETASVAFMGGSITEMEGYRPLVCAELKKRFPDTEFDFIDAGIASTCSTTGAFRLAEDVLSKGRIDLFFVEFAVNDDQDAAHTYDESVRGMEGIIRHLRTHNPNADIVITYFVNPDMLETIQSGEVPTPIAAHEAVAEHYSVSSINVAAEVAEQITAGELTWNDYGGTHPGPVGHALCAGLVFELLDRGWEGEAAKPQAVVLPERLDPYCYERGRFLSAESVQLGSSWRRQRPDWNEIAGQCRGGFVNEQLWTATTPGSELTLQFAGTAVGAYVLAGPDAGTLNVSIDGGEPQTVDLYHRFSKGLHYPRTVMFADTLEPGRHSVRVRVSESRNAESAGHAARVLQFVAN